MAVAEMKVRRLSDIVRDRITTPMEALLKKTITIERVEFLENGVRLYYYGPDGRRGVAVSYDAPVIEKLRIVSDEGAFPVQARVYRAPGRREIDLE